jgi:transcription elongation factor Elf1
MKTCTTCRIPKAPDEFNRNRVRKDGLQNICRACSSQRSQLYYQTRPDQHRQATRQRRALKRKSVKQKIDDIKQRLGCRRCGENDIVCLEFHHIDPAGKDFDIAQAMTYEWPWETVLAEIRKCVCLCANCHRKAHAERFDVTADMRCTV